MQLAQLLVAHSHIIEDLQGNVLISTAPVQVHNVEHSMGFLQEEQSIFKLLLLDVNQRAFIELE